MSHIPPGAKRIAYIALGSNLDSIWGSRAQTLESAIGDLRELGSIVACSSFYETDPVGVRDQPPFLNAVLALETELNPLDLLDRMLAMERKFGRERSASTPKGPRTLDLDLLLVENLVIRSEGLTLPHFALVERRFVLVPLAEIAPGLRPPGLSYTVAELLARLPDEGENRISAVRRWTHGEPPLRSNSKVS